jgi:hypothetical protein
VEWRWLRSLLLAGALAAGVLAACVVGASAGAPHAAYLNLWYGFLRHMASEFRNDRNFVMVAAAGPTSVSDEMSLPDWTGQTITRPDGNPDSDPARQALGGSDIATWEALGYDPATYVAAWARTFRMYRKIFPNPVHVAGAHRRAADRALTRE